MEFASFWSGTLADLTYWRIAREFLLDVCVGCFFCLFFGFLFFFFFSKTKIVLIHKSIFLCCLPRVFRLLLYRDVWFSSVFPVKKSHSQSVIRTRPHRLVWRGAFSFQVNPGYEPLGARSDPRRGLTSVSSPPAPRWEHCCSSWNLLWHNTFSELAKPVGRSLAWHQQPSISLGIFLVLQVSRNM